MALDTPTWLQNGTYSARLDRLFADVLFTEGVMQTGPGQLLVTQRGAGANNTVDIAAGYACIAGDDTADQGKYLIRNRATVNLAASAAPVANSRIDLVCLRVNDTFAGGPAGNNAQFIYVAGVAAGVPVAPATPTSAIALARVLRTVGDASVVTANITDVRTQSLTILSNTLTNAGDLLSFDGVNSTRVALGSTGLPLVAGVSSVGYAQLGTTGIADLAVTTGKLANDSVSLAKMQANSVDSSKIVDGSIATADIADSAITSLKIANGAILTADIADSQITSAKILDGTIATADIADSAITGAKIAPFTITGGDIALTTISNVHIVDGTLTGAKIGGGQITGFNIADGTITAADIQNGTISADKMSNQSFSENNQGGLNLTVGVGGYSTFRYFNLGKLWFFYGDVSIGSSGFSVGAVELDMPSSSGGGGIVWQHNYIVKYYDASANVWFAGAARYVSASRYQLLGMTEFGAEILQPLSATFPFTWAVNDRIMVSGWYEGI